LPASIDARAVDENEVEQLKADLDALQQELDRSTARVEDLRTRENDLRFAVARTSEEIRTLQLERQELEARAVSAARRIYMSSNSEVLEVLLTSESWAEIARESQALTHVSQFDLTALRGLEQAENDLVGLRNDLIEEADALTATRARLEEETEQLQGKFQAATQEYVELKKKLAAARARRAAAVDDGIAFITSSGMTCPIAAPNSFIDSWGFPRDGGARTHEGADVMAEMGAPVVAVIDGAITYEGVGVTAGNWLELTGVDGNVYWYMHNQKNLVTTGRVKVGEQIATVGDTGNALGGPPHVHFELHPGDGGPINPYPLLVDICRKN
jgi:murein DD-endopeptidase MepM/ murein hydrolase activator NlpD